MTYISSSPSPLPSSTMLQAPYKNNSHTYAALPMIDELIETLGGEDYLKVIINARDFEYDITQPYADIYNSVKVAVRFTLGWPNDQWICGVVWRKSTYSAELRPLPLCKETPDKYYLDFQAPHCLRDWLEVRTQFALSF